MKTLLRLEELAEFLFSIYLFSLLPFPWWVYPVLFVAPDLALLGLVAGRRVGALTYNLIHHKAVAFGLFALGALLGLPPVSLAGTILLGHSSLDRVLGFGLMDGKTFTHTHLKLTGQGARHTA